MRRSALWGFGPTRRLPFPTVRKLGDTIARYLARRRRADRRSDITELSPVSGIEPATQRASNHISKLNPHTHMGWGEKQRLDETPIVAGKRAFILNDSIMAGSEHLILLPATVIRHHDAKLPRPYLPRHIL